MAGAFTMLSTLAALHHAERASLSEVAISPTPKPSPSDKLHTALRIAWEIRKQSDHARGVQLLFLDFGTPGGKADREGELCLYRYLRDVLVGLGESPNEIAFVHDFPGKAILTLEKRAQSGEVRYILGSRIKLGTGRNIQSRLIALHHFDCPLSPRRFIQSEGRIDRPGNGWSKGLIFYYGMIGSCYESWVRSTIAHKRELSHRLRRGAITESTVSDLGLTAEDLETQSLLLSGDEIYRQYILARKSREKASSQREACERQIRMTRAQLEKLPQQIAAARTKRQTLTVCREIEQAELLLPKLRTNLVTYEDQLPRLREVEKALLEEERQCHRALGQQQDPPPFVPPQTRDHRPSPELIEAIKTMPSPKGYLSRNGEPVDWLALVQSASFR